MQIPLLPLRAGRNSLCKARSRRCFSCLPSCYHWKTRGITLFKSSFCSLPKGGPDFWQASPAAVAKEFHVKKVFATLATLGLFAALAASAFAQAPPAAKAPSAAPSSTAAPSGSATGTVSHTTKAINYRRAGGMTKVDFNGTELMQGASGEARVESKSNRMEIDAKFAGLEDATKFGLEYLTYVLWAVSPQGRAVNLGELPLKNGAGQVKAICDMQTFGMIVTAEPYFAVTQPGNMVVLDNILAPGMQGKVENIDAQYELIGRGAYSSSQTKIDNAIFGIDRKTPLELFEARNAVRIAQIALADKYAASSLARAQQQLKNAEDVYRRGSDKKAVIAAAREVVETAEESRVMAVKQKAELDAQAAAAAARKAAEDQAAAEARRRQDAELARQQAEQAKADAVRMKQEAEAAAADAAKQKAEAEAAAAAARQQQEAAQAAAEQAARDKAAALDQQRAAEAELRSQLLNQLNSILQTRDSARGLIVNMSDVLFDTGSYTLKPGAREKLAKISGILLAHPGLTMQIEGHTDSVGTDEFNQQLSERRADSVRDFLAQNGVPGTSITARGFGKTQPVASNDTAEGRQRNRRVELVVNGDAIGGTANASAATSNR